MPSGVGLAIGANVVGGLAGASAAKRGARANREAQEKALKEYMKVNMPSLSEQEIDLVIPQLMGELNPEAEQMVELGPSQMEEVSVDEALKQKQMDALNQISEVAEGGLTEADQAAARQMQRQVEQSNTARQKAILNEMAQRGVMGSGIELAQRMGAAQQAAEQQQSAQDALIQQAQQRALQAMGQQGSMAGSIRSQDFGEQSAKARASDEIARANVMNQIGMQQRNVSARNQAQMANLQAKQRLEDLRAQTMNQQLLTKRLEL